MKKLIFILLLSISSLSTALANTIYCPKSLKCPSDDINSCTYPDGNTNWYIGDTTGYEPGNYYFYSADDWSGIAFCTYYTKANIFSTIYLKNSEALQVDTSNNKNWVKESSGDYSCEVKNPLGCPYKPKN